MALLSLLLSGFVAPGVAQAQLLGHNIAGDFGLNAATQPPPGVYLSVLYLNYDGDTLRDRNGDPIGDPERRGDLDVNGYGIGAWWVTDKTLFGGTYSAMVWPSWSNNTLEAPILGLEQKGSTEFGDIYIQPVNLGWSTKRVDYMAGIGLFAPTGSYDVEVDNNGGLGMWSYELFGGATIYFDEARTWTFAALAFYEWHGKKDGTDVRVGDLLTIEGGLGKSFMEGALNVGLAYYGQWKVSDDDFGADSPFPPGLEPGRHRGFGVGPEVDIPLASKSKLYGFLNLRYFREFGNRSTVEGDNFVLTLTFPWGGVPLQ